MAIEQARKEEVEITEGPKTLEEIRRLLESGEETKLEVTIRKGHDVSSEQYRAKITMAPKSGAKPKIRGKIFMPREGSRRFEWRSFSATYDIEMRAGGIKFD